MPSKLEPGDIRAIARKPRMWDAELPVTDYLEGPLESWPASMQDKVYEAMEQLLAMTGVKAVDILQTTCFVESGLYVARITLVERLGVEDVVIIHG